MFFQQLPYKLIIYAAAQLPGHCLGGSLLLGLSDCAKMRTTTAQREAAKSIAKLQPEGLGMRRVCDLPPTLLEVFFLVMTDRFNQIFIQFWAHFWCLLKVQSFSRVHSTGPCTGLEPLNQSKELGEERRSPIRSSSEVQSFYW